jgi:hypothetical protein
MFERLSDAVHKIWVNWMVYMFSVCIKNSDGSVTIPKEKVERWMRQINTDYNDLSEKEKDSDRHIVSKFLSFID